MLRTTSLRSKRKGRISSDQNDVPDPPPHSAPPTATFTIKRPVTRGVPPASPTRPLPPPPTASPHSFTSSKLSWKSPFSLLRPITGRRRTDGLGEGCQWDRLEPGITVGPRKSFDIQAIAPAHKPSNDAERRIAHRSPLKSTASASTASTPTKAPLAPTTLTPPKRPVQRYSMPRPSRLSEKPANSLETISGILPSESSKMFDSLLEAYGTRSRASSVHTPARPRPPPLRLSQVKVKDDDATSRGLPQLMLEGDSTNGTSSDQPTPLLPSSHSLTPLQLMRSAGYMASPLIRDESMPFEIFVTGNSFEDHSPLLATPSKSTLLLRDEEAPFDLETQESMYSLFTHVGLGVGEKDKSPTKSEYVPSPPPPLRSKYRPVSWQPPRKVDIAEVSGKDPVVVEFNKLQWPLPPRRCLIITGNTGEVWIEPDVECLNPDNETSQRFIVCIPEAGDKSPTKQSDLLAKPGTRSHKVTFTSDQLRSLAQHLHLPELIPPPASPRAPTPTRRATPKPRSTMWKMTEARIDAENTAQAIQVFLYLSSTYSPGQINKITIVAASWCSLSSFCSRNSRSILAPIAQDHGRQLIVTVRDCEADDGETQVLCSMWLEGAKLPAGPTLGARKTVAKFTIGMPVSLKDIGERCKGKGLGEGVESALPKRGKSRRNGRIIGR